MPERLKYLFENNKQWAERIKQEDPAFFEQLSKEQHPEYLWIGCSDSRVPTNQIINLPPGEIFVHRNIANMVLHTDLNCLSVIQYAVEVLKVKHVIVCGHYGCGGVKASLEKEHHGLVDHWLRHIKDVYRLYEPELESLDEDKKIRRLCEYNVIEQVKNVGRSTVVRQAWKGNADLSIHGWIYDLKDGLLTDLGTSLKSIEELEQVGG